MGVGQREGDMEEAGDENDDHEELLAELEEGGQGEEADCEEARTRRQGRIFEGMRRGHGRL